MPPAVAFVRRPAVRLDKFDQFIENLSRLFIRHRTGFLGLVPAAALLQHQVADIDRRRPVDDNVKMVKATNALFFPFIMRMEMFRGMGDNPGNGLKAVPCRRYGNRR